MWSERQNNPSRVGGKIDATFIFFILSFPLWVHNMWCYCHGLGHKNGRVYLYGASAVIGYRWIAVTKFMKFLDKDWIWICKIFRIWIRSWKIKIRSPLFTTLLWQNNGRQNGLISRMLFSELYKIMVNKVHFAGCRVGERSPPPGSAPVQARWIRKPLWAKFHSRSFFTQEIHTNVVEPCSYLDTEYIPLVWLETSST